MVTNKAEIVALLCKHQDELKRLGVRRYALFGSFARAGRQPKSDIDLLVDFDPDQKTFDNFMELVFFLESLFGRRVDLVTPEALSPHIGPHILREAEYAEISG